MVVYDIKRGHWKFIEGDKLPELIAEIFGSVEREGDTFISSFGAMSRIEVSMLSNTELEVVTVSDMGTSDSVVLESKRRLNQFAERASGFNAKQRQARLKKKVKEGTV